MISLMDQPPLLSTKINIPPLRRRRVPRPRLLERLALDPDLSLILVSAPAGFGKTTLLSEWAHAIKEKGERIKDEEERIKDKGEGIREELSSSFIPSPLSFIVWLSLDEGENDPVRFFDYVIESVGRACGSAVDLRSTRAALPLLAGPGWEGCLTLFLNELERLDQPCILILDDYHQIHAPAVHTMVAWLVERLPAGCCLAIGSRSTPPLPLSRLRARGKMVELRAADLRFTEREAAEFIHLIAGVELSAEDLARLSESCEGWAAGVQLAGLALQARLRQAGTENAEDLPGAEPDAMGLSGLPARMILNYLIDEVFSQQPPDIQEFLLKTSILDRLTGPLCDDVTRAGSCLDVDSESILENLEEQNLFTLPLDEAGRWYRYHRLFAGALRVRLEKTHPEWIPDLHRQAAAWLAGQRLYGEAIRHALSAPDFEQAACAIEKVIDGLLARAELLDLAGWIKAVPDEVLKAHPALRIGQIWIAAMQGDFAGLEDRLNKVEADLPSLADRTAASIQQGKVEALRGFAGLNQRNPAETVQFAERALILLSPDDLFWRGVASRVLGEAYLRAGDFAAGNRAILQSSQISLSAGDLQQGLSALCQVAGIQFSQGQLKEAERTYQTGFDRIRRDGWEKHPYTGLLESGFGALLVEWNRLDEAEAHLRTALDFGEPPEFRSVALAAMPGMARLALAHKDPAGAAAWLARLDEEVRRQLPPGMPSPMGGLLARYSLAMGKGDQALAWAESSGLRFDDPAVLGREQEYFILASGLLWQGHNQPDGPCLEQSLQLLDRILEAARLRNLASLSIEALVARSLAEMDLRWEDQACKTLKEALIRAQPEAYMQIFLDYAPALRPVLLRLIQAISRDEALFAYAGRILHAIDRPGVELPKSPAHPAEPPSAGEYIVASLSEREREVLQLVARGASNQEIAERLVLSVATVKSHVNHIMNKLCAQNRTEAVTRARDLGWIP